MKMEAAFYYETSVFTYNTALCYDPEENNMNNIYIKIIGAKNNINTAFT
jgi:hypothetical protein